MTQYNNQQLDVRKAYFVGSNTLVAGQPLCRQEVPGSSTLGFGFDVEIPNADNESHFAGIVHPSSVGKVGPCLIDIIVPRRGDFLQVLRSNLVDGNANEFLRLNFDVPTAAGTELGAFSSYAASTALTLATSLGGSVAALGAIPGAARALETFASTADTTNTRVLKWVEFL